MSKTYISTGDKTFQPTNNFVLLFGEKFPAYRAKFFNSAGTKETMKDFSSHMNEMQLFILFSLQGEISLVNLSKFFYALIGINLISFAHMQRALI